MPSGPVPPFRPSLIGRLQAWWARRVDRSIGWDQLPRYTGALVLAGIRTTLRWKNLHDTSALPAVHPTVPAVKGDRHLTTRTADGSFNDLSVPAMGSAGTRFGRNVPLKYTYPEADRSLLTPSPRVVSRRLLTRETFIPATSLNLLAAAWLQFMVHDWLSHGKNQKENPWRVELDRDDPWPQRPMQILRTRPDPTRPKDATGPPTFANTATHWWDASQLYGGDHQAEAMVRAGEGGKLKIESNRLLPVDPQTGIERTGVSGNWWLGLDLLHTLFTLEHNAICDRLRAEYPSWSDQELFDRARLINAALLAKIHTVDWTPAILGHPTLEVAMRANWWGLAGERIHGLLGRVSQSEVISGIPGSETNHFGVPYSITEEFVAVYRMHPLIPDDFVFRAPRDDRVIEERSFPEVAFKHARQALERIGMEDSLYSFGHLNPGAITLHNFPRAMQRLEEPDGTVVDLAATDILRVRERGVPRYNEFRRLLHKPPVRRFEDLSDNPEWVEQIRKVYEGKIDRVDLIVGLYSEPLPKGFGFSDTAFRIFILMASRRLNSDRFFTTDFTPEVYTPAGLKWVDDNGFASVLLRHFPGLRPALRNVRNPFAPWARVGAA
ncbi:MAG: heme peroxidase [Candidatus Dormibacteraeota bacterium]|nr:heme peroxidase [Candidatus Dormibacteraeota bacterium]